MWCATVKVSMLISDIDGTEHGDTRDGAIQFVDRSHVHRVGASGHSDGVRDGLYGANEVSFSFQQVRLQELIQRRSCYSIVEGTGAGCAEALKL